MFGRTASNLHAACGVVIVIRNAQIMKTKILHLTAAIASWQKERPHPATYRGCKLAKYEILRRKTPPAAARNTAGRTIASKLVNPSTSYAAALRNNTQQQQRHQGQPTQAKDNAGDQHQTTKSTQQATREQAKDVIIPLYKNTEDGKISLSSGQSVRANDVNSSSLNNMFKVAAIVQQIMTELNGAVTEEQKIVVITRTVFNLVKDNGR
jgi:hypothetical protein